MRSRCLGPAILALMLFAGACSGSPTQPGGTAPGDGSTAPTGGGWLSAEEAVALAYEALTADWKSTAKLAFVGRYSQFCGDCSPYDVEEDEGIGADGRQAHWVVIFAEETASSGDVFLVEDGAARLVSEGGATIRPDELFPLDGWVDSTEIAFRTSQPVGLELRTNDLFEDVDPELSDHPLLWLAETSFGRFDVYDAATGRYIKSR